MNNKLKIFLILIFLALCTFGQDQVSFETPYIKKFTRDDYNAHDQNWNIAQDSLGLIYVANNDALLIYDGEIWQKIKLHNVWGLISNEKGVVYFGADNIFGKIEYGSKGDIRIKSFTEQLDKKDRNTGIIQDIYYSGDTTYFLSFNSVFIFVNDKYDSVIKIGTRILGSFLINNQLYYNDKNKGLKKIDNGKIKKLHINENILGSYVFKIINVDDKSLILSSKGLFYTKSKKLNLNSNNFKHLDPELSKLIIRVGTTKFKKLSNSKIALYSLTDGILIYNLKTKYKTFLNKQNGLSTNSIISVFEDRDLNLWISTYEGINYVELNYPVRIISEENFTADIITSVNNFKEDIVFTTLSGLYKVKKDRNSNQIYIHDYNINESCTGTIEYEDHLYASSIRGFGEIQNNKFIEIEDFNVPYLLLKIKQFPNYFLLGGGSGITILKYEKGKIYKVKNIESSNVDSRYVVEHNGYLWFSIKKGIVSRIKTKDILTDSIIIEDFYLTDSLNTNNMFINLICNKLIVQDGEIIKEFDYKKTEFIETNLKNSIDNSDMIELYIDEGNCSWISNSNILKHLCYKDGKFIENNKFITRINNIKVSSIFKDTLENRIWIGGTNKIGLINNNKVDTNLQDFKILIRNIRVNDSTIFYGYNLNDSIQNLFQRKSQFLFNFATQFYQANDENKYSYKLEGYNKAWSDWSDINFANYTNLDYGTYTFKVKARNIFGKESNIEQFTFEVEPAFYQTWYAYLLFVIILALIILLVIYLNGKRLKGINLKLEKQIEERTIEIREQNKELEKLSIVASETDNSVMIYDEDYNLEWVNDGEIRNFGYTLEEIYKKFGRTIIELSFYPKINEVIKEIEETKNSGHYNSKGIRKDGSEIWSRTTLTPIIGENGKIKKIIAIDSDITELKYAEEKIRAQHILITQSLEYAKKIQDAVLPSLSSLKKEVEDAFILFKPKDIVSGDFFWMHNISGKIIVATADCTGHGVPGGFMSMIGNSLMNEIVKEKHITSPSYILSLMDEKINDLFSKSESGQADGMDVAIATIDKKEGIIEIASANQSMYIIDDDEIIEFEGDIWSIGGVFSKKATGNFKSKIINITENTRLYMSSDGYQDQFGGSNDTKILKPNFIKLLKENSDKPLIEQEKNIEKFLESWVGNGKQTDDILVIGIKM
jgi:PAS domain S-box-containing protein